MLTVCMFFAILVLACAAAAGLIATAQNVTELAETPSNAVADMAAGDVVNQRAA